MNDINKKMALTNGYIVYIGFSYLQSVKLMSSATPKTTTKKSKTEESAASSKKSERSSRSEKTDVKESKRSAKKGSAKKPAESKRSAKKASVKKQPATSKKAVPVKNKKPQMERRLEKISDGQMKTVRSFLRSHKLEVGTKDLEGLRSSLLANVAEVLRPKDKKDRDPTQPNRPLSVYFRFTGMNRDTFKKEAKEAGQKFVDYTTERWVEWKSTKEGKKTIEQWRKEEKDQMVDYKTDLEKWKKKNGIVSKPRGKKQSGEPKRRNALTCFKEHWMRENPDSNHPQAVLEWNRMEDGDKEEQKDKSCKNYWKRVSQEYNREHGLLTNKKKTEEE